MLCTYTRDALDPVLGEHRLNVVPQPLFDNRRMFSQIGFALVGNFTTVNSVLK